MTERERINEAESIWRLTHADEYSDAQVREVVEDVIEGQHGAVAQEILARMVVRALRRK